MDLSEADILKVFEDSDEDDLLKIDGKNDLDKQFDQNPLEDNFGIFHDHGLYCLPYTEKSWANSTEENIKGHILHQQYENGGPIYGRCISKREISDHLNGVHSIPTQNTRMDSIVDMDSVSPPASMKEAEKGYMLREILYKYSVGKLVWRYICLECGQLFITCGNVIKHRKFHSEGWL